MDKINKLMLKYVNSASSDEALKYENLLYIYFFIPIFIFVAVFNTVFYPFFGASLRMTLLNTAALVVNILILVIAKVFVKSEKIKSYMIIFGFTACLIYLVAHYYNYLWGVVWIVAAIFVVIAMGRNDNKLLIFITIDIIALSVYVMLRYPEFNAIHIFVSQCLAFFGLIFVISMIKKVHKKRIAMISSQLKQSEIVSQISSEMITINQDNYEDKIEKFLDIIGKLYNMDRLSVMKLSSDRLTISHEIEWVAPGIERIIGKVKTVVLADDYWWNEQLESCRMIVLSNVDSLKPEQSNGKIIMQSLNIKSLLSIPIVMNDIFYGFLIANCVNDYETWRDDEKRMMTVLANILGDAYLKLEKEKEITHMAYCDALTGLPNRILFNEKLKENVEKSKIHKINLAVLFIDLDSFKSVNDTMGHESGDALLTQIADNLKRAVTQNEFVARFGGDEFIVLITRFSNMEQLNDRAQKIMEVLNTPISVNNQDFYVTASAGIALYPDDGENGETLVKNADLAMYEAKNLGKNHFMFCNAGMKEVVKRQVYMTNMLNKALENDEFVLYYQPQINLSTKKIVGVEALIRWDNPELGMIMPSVFIPLAEQSGLIHAIGKWVLETAFRQNKKWQDAGFAPIRIAVNLSVEQFRNPNLVQTVSSAIKQTGLEAQYAELEVTESIAIKEIHNIVPTLLELRALGLTISIDDFGTEYSSLVRIKNLPVDRIKMAMEFVQGITVSDKDEAIAMSILTLANSLGMKVIAEGVETEPQLKFLERKICDEVQGFYFYKPMPAEKIEKILKEQTSQ